MGTSTIPAVLDELKTALELRAGLVGVTVFSAHMGDEVTRAPEAIVLGLDVPFEQNFASLGAQSRDEEYTIEGVVLTTQPGAGEDAAKAARDRAFYIVAEIEDQLRADAKLGERALWAGFGTGRFQQGTGDRTRIAAIEFGIKVKARI